MYINYIVIYLYIKPIFLSSENCEKTTAKKSASHFYLGFHYPQCSRLRFLQYLD